MAKISRDLQTPCPNPARQAGVAAVEFGMVVIVFLLFVFVVFEIARMMYVYNTAQEVTRFAANGAAKTDFKNTGELDKLRQNAVLRNSPGELPLGDPISDQHVRIDYLALVRNADNSLTMTEIPDMARPACRGENRRICMENPNATNCIRFVRARICDPLQADTCEPVGLKSLSGLLMVTVKMPTAPTIATAESLGYIPGTKSCP